MIINFHYFKVEIKIFRLRICDGCEKHFYYELKENLCKDCLFNKMSLKNVKAPDLPNRHRLAIDKYFNDYDGEE